MTAIRFGDHQATLHGVVFDILVGSENQFGRLAGFPMMIVDWLAGVVFLTLRTLVIPGRATWREPQMRNGASGHPEVMATRVRVSAVQAPE